MSKEKQKVESSDKWTQINNKLYKTLCETIYKLMIACGLFGCREHSWEGGIDRDEWTLTRIALGAKFFYMISNIAWNLRT
jgi:hypothetical protein